MLDLRLRPSIFVIWSAVNSRAQAAGPVTTARDRLAMKATALVRFMTNCTIRAGGVFRRLAGPRGAAPARRGLARLALDALDIELDEDVVADDQAAVVQGLAPVHAEILAVQLALRREARADVPPGVFRLSVEPAHQGDFPGY